MQWDFSDHAYPVNGVAWSMDDTILLTAAEQQIKMWDTQVSLIAAMNTACTYRRLSQTGTLIRTLEAHTETVTALAWLPDNSGFISGGMDRKIILWDVHGKQRDSWGMTSIRVTDLAIAPDMRRVVALGMYFSTPSAEHDSGATPPAVRAAPIKENRMIVYDFASKQVETLVIFLTCFRWMLTSSHRTVQLEGELTSVKVSADSRYAIINHAPDVGSLAVSFIYRLLT
jgi:WD40 repeat protein